MTPPNDFADHEPATVIRTTGVDLGILADPVAMAAAASSAMHKAGGRLRASVADIVIVDRVLFERVAP